MTKNTINAIWVIKGRKITLSPFPRWMGILNATPDSFSDGGMLSTESLSDNHPFQIDANAAFQKGVSLFREGADILDIGGESTRPGSLPVPPQEQLARVIPVIERLTSLDVPISIDTTSAEVADHALSAGASIVNDVSGTTFDPDMKEVVRSHRAGICISHIRGIPETMQNAPFYDNAPQEVAAFLREKKEELICFGISPDQIVLDPGIGFGKNLSHNVAILSQLDILSSIGSPILIGHSRKRFLSEIDSLQKKRLTDPTCFDVSRNDFLTAALSKRLLKEGVALFRVHRVEYNRICLNNPNFPELQFPQFNTNN